MGSHIVRTAACQPCQVEWIAIVYGIEIWLLPDILHSSKKSGLLCSFRVFFYCVSCDVDGGSKCAKFMSAPPQFSLCHNKLVAARLGAEGVVLLWESS